MIKRHNLLPGLTLILLAVVMMGTAMGLIPDIPWFRLAGAVLLGSWTIKALTDRDFFGMFFSVSLIAWLFEDALKIEHLAPFPLVVAAAFLGIGLNMIIGKRNKTISFEYSNEEGKHGSINWNDAEEVSKEKWTEGRSVLLENTFNSTSKYVNSVAFSNAKLENAFGSANVYFNNATVYENQATIELDNAFGEMNIYLPGKWRASISQNSTFGHVTIHGEPNRDMDAPLVIIKAESAFGALNIYFD